MTRIFEQRNNFDLRGLIGGTEIFLDSLGKLMNTYPGFMLGAIQCLTMPRELRDKVGAVLGRAKCKVGPVITSSHVTPAFVYVKENTSFTAISAFFPCNSRCSMRCW
jgi:hypothetical protein